MATSLPLADGEAKCAEEALPRVASKLTCMGGGSGAERGTAALAAAAEAAATARLLAAAATTAAAAAAGERVKCRGGAGESSGTAL